MILSVKINIEGRGGCKFLKKAMNSFKRILFPRFLLISKLNSLLNAATSLVSGRLARNLLSAFLKPV